MRVLQALAGSHHGGAERLFERLAPALSENGIEQRLLIGKDEKREAELAARGMMDVHVLPFGNRLDLMTKIGFRHQIRRFAPDIVLTWMSRATAMAPKSPLSGRAFKRVGYLGDPVELRYFQDCDHLLADCESAVAEAVAGGFPAERVTHLPSFVEPKPGRPLHRAELFLPEAAPVMLALGGLQQDKGFDLLLHSLVLLPEVYLLLAGNGPERPELEALAVRLGVKPRLRFLGWRSDVENLMATADLLVNPARIEYRAHSILEAWAHRLPVVATATEAAARLVEDGVTGILAPVGDAARLADLLRNTLNDRDGLARLADTGFTRFERDFSKPVVVAQYCAYFERIIA